MFFGNSNTCVHNLKWFLVLIHFDLTAILLGFRFGFGFTHRNASITNVGTDNGFLYIYTAENNCACRCMFVFARSPLKCVLAVLCVTLTNCNSEIVLFRFGDRVCVYVSVCDFICRTKFTKTSCCWHSLSYCFCFFIFFWICVFVFAVHLKKLCLWWCMSLLDFEVIGFFVLIVVVC